MPIHIKREDEKARLDAKNTTLDFAYPNYNPTLIGLLNLIVLKLRFPLAKLGTQG